MLRKIEVSILKKERKYEEERNLCVPQQLIKQKIFILVVR